MHPLHQFEYCPKCGTKAFVERNEKAKQCTACGFIYYFNPSSAVACFIRNSKGELPKNLPKGRSICRVVLLTCMNRLKKQPSEK